MLDILLCGFFLLDEFLNEVSVLIWWRCSFLWRSCIHRNAFMLIVVLLILHMLYWLLIFWHSSAESIIIVLFLLNLLNGIVTTELTCWLDQRLLLMLLYIWLIWCNHVTGQSRSVVWIVKCFACLEWYYCVHNRCNLSLSSIVTCVVEYTYTQQLGPKEGPRLDVGDLQGTYNFSWNVRNNCSGFQKS